MTTELEEHEQRIRAAWEAGDLHRAATIALSAYGQDIAGFLIAHLRNAEGGREAFAMFAEDLWVGLPNFGWRCSMRGWCYVLARNAAHRYARRPDRAPHRNLSLPHDATQILAQHTARETTAPYQRTEIKARIRALRERLEPDEQALLTLHVEKRLPWRELAMVMHDEGERLGGARLDRESARVRKRFERVKARLKQLARDEGLLNP